VITSGSAAITAAARYAGSRPLAIAAAAHQIRPMTRPTKGRHAVECLRRPSSHFPAGNGNAVNMLRHMRKAIHVLFNGSHPLIAYYIPRRNFQHIITAGGKPAVDIRQPATIILRPLIIDCRIAIDIIRNDYAVSGAVHKGFQLIRHALRRIGIKAFRRKHFIGKQRRDAVQQERTFRIRIIQAGQDIPAAFDGFKAPSIAVSNVAGNAKDFAKMLKDLTREEAANLKNALEDFLK